MLKILSLGLSIFRFFLVNILGLIGVAWFFLGCIGVTLPIIGVIQPMNWYIVWLGIVLYFFGMFGITAGYHRYFAHRTYKTTRTFQFFLALNGVLTLQWGPILWSYCHRHHHKFSDKPGDLHSPIQDGFLWSQWLWIFFQIKLPEKISHEKDMPLLKKLWHWFLPPMHAYPEKVHDISHCWELRLLDRWWAIPAVILAVVMWWYLSWEGLFVFFVRTMLLWNFTFFINSLTHLFGSRRFETKDKSRNLWWLFPFVLGENWHNNHHHRQSMENQGLFWWEVDITHYILMICRWFRIVWEVRVGNLKNNQVSIYTV